MCKELASDGTGRPFLHSLNARSEAQGAKRASPKIREQGGGEGSPGCRGVRPCSSGSCLLHALAPCSQPGSGVGVGWGAECPLLSGARREGAGGERQEALLELSRGNFVGKGDKEEHQKDPSVCGEEPSGLNSLPARRGDEKADRRQPRVPEPSCSAGPSSHRAGEPAGCPWGCDSLAFFIYWRGGTHEITPHYPGPMQRAMLCSW